MNSENSESGAVLNESEGLLKKVIQQSPISMAIVRFDGVIEYINDRAVETFGFLPEDIPTMERWWVQAYPDEQYRSQVIAQWMGLVQQAMTTGGEIERRDYQVTCKDGNIKTMVIFGVIVANKVFVLFEDITSRKEAEEAALREREQNFSALAENAWDGIIICTVSGNIIFANMRAAEISGYSLAELRDMSFLKLADPDEIQRFTERLFERNFGDDLPNLLETRIVSRAGVVVPVEMTAAITIWNGQPANLIILRDITARVRTQEALLAAKQAAETANQAKSQFLACMSHELRTPLNPILGFTELLAEAPNLTEEQRLWLLIVNQRGKDLLALIGSVLDLSKMEAEKITISRQKVMLRKLIREIADSFSPLLEKKSLRLDWDVEKVIPEEVLSDGLRLRQLLMNLLTNAIKFTEAGEVSIRVHDGSTSRLLREPAEDEYPLLFSIRDTGIGIDQEHQSAIFDDFVQGDPEHATRFGGAGLGLAISRRLVELMGGKLWVESEKGKGSTFSFTILVGLPTIGVPVAEQPTEVSHLIETPLLRILVVDDDPTSRILAKARLQADGHTVQTVDNGRQAVELTAHESFDLVLMDVWMPVMDGIEATRAIRERERLTGGHLIIVALTAIAQEGDKDKLLELGMDAYLSKPVVSAKLEETIRKAFLPGTNPKDPS